MKKKINVHPSKLWALIYPMYAKEIMLGMEYEALASNLSANFYLTPEQWEAVLNEYEFLTAQILIK